MADPLTTVIKFLGGCIVGAAIHWASITRIEKEKRHSSYIHEQLEKLYGPLYFLTSQNEELFKLSKNILSAHREYFDGQEWSSNEKTQESVRSQSKATIELSNEYSRQVVKNNETIVEILRNNYAFIDSNDIVIFQEFVIDALRMNKEINEDRLKEIPIDIYYALGEISYSRTEFLDGIKNKFLNKQENLKKYH